MDVVSGILSALEVVFGVSFLILFHEFGHFIVARLAGVRVETFSLGFGPRLFGWSRGATDYRVSAVPLGGYVKLAGESPVAGATGAPDELFSKKGRWRAAIFLAGIAFNALFAVVLFPILFLVGVPFIEPVVGGVVPGGPAWLAGLEPGSRILSINGTPIYSFEQIHSEVALADSSKDHPLLLRVRIPAGEERDLPVVPDKDKGQGLLVIQVEPSPDPEGRIDVDPGSPAEQAGLRSGDRLVGVNGVRGEGLFEELERAMRRGAPIRVAVARGARAGEAAGDNTEEIEISPRRRDPRGYQIGIAPFFARVKAVRDPLQGAGILPGDRLVAIDGRPILGEEDQRAARASSAPEVVLSFEGEGGRSYEVVRPTPTPADRVRVVDALALEADDGNRVVPVPGLPAEKAGLRPGDRIVAVDGRPMSRWAEIFAAIARVGAAPVLVEVERDGRRLDPIRVEPVPRTEPDDFGFRPRIAMSTVRAGSLPAACSYGWRATVQVVQDLHLAIRRMAKREMSARNLSGIVSIVGISYRFTQVSFTKFLFFLGVLSVNLALINLLPIPLLDGGHLLFLAIEKLKGSPLSERALTFAQVAGLVVIGGLVVFVTWNDIDKLFSR